MKIPKIGIDKLILTTKDYQIADYKAAHFHIKRDKPQGILDQGLPYLLTDSRGNELQAWGMFHNSPEVSVNIDYRKGLSLQLNPNKLVSFYYPKLTEINSSEYNEAIDNIDKHLVNKLGVKLNIEAMKVNRIDLAKQNTMQHPIFQYSQAFKLLSSRRKMNKRTYLETYTIGNSQHQVCFYDKQAEQTALGFGEYVEKDNNLLRGEIRLLKSKTTQKIIGSSTLADTRKLAPTDIAGLYTSYMNKNIFTSTSFQSQLLLGFDKQLELILYLKKNYPNRAVTMYLQMINIDQGLLELGGIDTLAKLFSEAGWTRNSVYRIRKLVEELLAIRGRLDTLVSKVSTASLIEELKIKFAA